MKWDDGMSDPCNSEYLSEAKLHNDMKILFAEFKRIGREDLGSLMWLRSYACGTKRFEKAGNEDLDISTLE
jgi:hypothetical protein